MGYSGLPMWSKVALTVLVVWFSIEVGCTLSGCTFSPGGAPVGQTVDALPIDADNGDGGIDGGTPDATIDGATPGPVVTKLVIDDLTIEAVRNGNSSAMNVHPVTVHVVTTPQGGNGRCQGSSSNGAEAEWPTLLGEDVSITLRPTETTTYSIRCFNLAGGLSYENDFTLQVMTFQVQPGTTILQGQRVDFFWQAPGAMSCTASGNGGWAQTYPGDAGQQLQVLPGGGGIAGMFDFTLTCTVAPGDIYQATIRVTVQQV